MMVNNLKWVSGEEKEMIFVRGMNCWGVNSFSHPRWKLNHRKFTACKSVVENVNQFKANFPQEVLIPKTTQVLPEITFNKVSRCFFTIYHF